MKNKGFTLIELLAVFVILGVIIMISVPAISSVINSSKEEAYNQQINIIENAARTYMSENSTELLNSCTAKSIEDLKKSGLLSNKDIKNPTNSSENITGYVIITKNGNKYKYKYSKTNTCS